MSHDEINSGELVLRIPLLDSSFDSFHGSRQSSD